MHQPGSEPEVPNGTFSPITRVIDPAYGGATNFIRNSLVLGPREPPASKENRMSNLLGSDT
jgi:hypothetical protein